MIKTVKLSSKMKLGCKTAFEQQFCDENISMPGVRNELMTAKLRKNTSRNYNKQTQIVGKRC